MSEEEQMWVEKYRPWSFEEMVNQVDAVRRLKGFVKNSAEMPHFLFSGPAGTGKTTASLILARSILGDSWRDNTLEMNASDERKLEDVRTKVKSFARHVPLGAGYRLIILDEADSMAPAAQPALRRIMEANAQTTRFILICNYSSKIIEPIQSRCAILRFHRLEADDIAGALENICKKEGVAYDAKALDTICEISSGDLRHAINTLQAAATIGKVTAENVQAIAGTAFKARVGEIVKIAVGGEFNKAREGLIDFLQRYGMSEEDFIKYVNEELFSLPLKDPGQAARVLAEYDSRLLVSSNPQIQLSALLAELGRLELTEVPAKKTR